MKTTLVLSFIILLSFSCRNPNEEIDKHLAYLKFQQDSAHAAWAVQADQDKINERAERKIHLHNAEVILDSIIALNKKIK